MMRFSTWNEIGLNRMSDEIAGAFNPLVVRESAGGDKEWSRHIWKRRKRMLRWLWKSRLARNERSTDAVHEEYDTVWGRGYERYQLQPDVHAKPWIWGDKRYWSNSVGATRFRQAILIRMIERLKPKSVVEIGCGNGINLILLACRFPEIAFTGLELTTAGHKAAVAFQQAHETLPAAMQQFAPLPLADPTAFRRINFVQGSAAELPFEAGAFDLSMTILALEQMERIRPLALAEIARVTARNAFLLEPFRELNSSGWLLLNRIKRDYFGGRVAELAQYGLKPEFMVRDYPQEVFLRTCAVLCKRV